MREKLVLIDGHSILNRAYYGIPTLTNSKGLHTNAIYGFLNIMFRILEEEQPTYLVIAFDVSAPTFRHEIYEAYKGTRKPMDPELREQVPVMKELLRAMNIVIVEHAGWEADDILGTLAKRAQKDGMDVALVSGDRDLLQIATDRIKIRIPKTKGGKTTIEDYYAEDVKKLYQVTPEQFIELKALMGDTSDNIPGVPKVGEKTAMELMVQFGSLDNIYEHIEEVTKKSVQASLRENKELAMLSKVLATIKTDCEVELCYEDAKAEGFYTEEAYGMMKELEFRNFLGRFTPEARSKGNSFQVDCHLCSGPEEMVKAMEAVQEKENVGLLLHLVNKKVAAVSLSVKEEGYFIYLDAPQEKTGQLSLFDMGDEKEVDTQALWKAVKELRRKATLATFDIKNQYDYYGFSEDSWDVRNMTENCFDACLAAYLLNPLKSDYDAASIAAEYLGKSILEEKEFFGKKDFMQMHDENPEGLAQYCVKQAYVAKEAMPVLLEKLKETKMDTIFREMEMPLSFVLRDMEKEGIAVQREELQRYGLQLQDRILVLEKEIHQLAGEPFNINSSKQLGEILFEKLQLRGGKKTKTGYSTAAEVLEKLVGEHPMVEKILEYRTLTKLKSTYADGLETCIGEDGRIHSTFHQTITATGRISSTEPNLQNIPIRMELGRKIRKVFVPREGYLFMDADYSQIELRVLAHMSRDEELIEAYNQEEDIHRITASKVFGVPLKDVTPLQRRNAKAVNFGIVYGISSFGLSQDLSIQRKEAEEYIRQYFDTYPGIKIFLDKLVSDAREKGYVTTMYGRRRPIPELKSSNFMQRSFGERIAMNSPIQGTAADIIKIAMVSVWSALKQRKLSSRLLLQIHDELLLEVNIKEEQEVREILTDCMQKAAQLLVKLEIDLQVGKNWYEAH